MTGLTARLWRLVFPWRSAASQTICSFLSLCSLSGRVHKFGIQRQSLGSEGRRASPSHQPCSAGSSGFLPPCVRAPAPLPRPFLLTLPLRSASREGQASQHTALRSTVSLLLDSRRKSRRALGFISTVLSTDLFISHDLLARPY